MANSGTTINGALAANLKAQKSCGVTASIIKFEMSNSILKDYIEIDKENDIIYFGEENLWYMKDEEGNDINDKGNKIIFAISYDLTELDVTFPIYFERDDSGKNISTAVDITRLFDQNLMNIDGRFTFVDFNALSTSSSVTDKPFYAYINADSVMQSCVKPSEPLYLESPWGVPASDDSRVTSPYTYKPNPRNSYDSVWIKRLHLRLPQVFQKTSSGWDAVSNSKSLVIKYWGIYGLSRPSVPTGEYLVMMPYGTTYEYLKFRQPETGETNYGTTWYTTTDSTDIANCSKIVVSYPWEGSGTSLATLLDEEEVAGKVVLLLKFKKTLSYTVDNSSETSITLPFAFGLESSLIEVDHTIDKTSVYNPNGVTLDNYSLLGLYNCYYDPNVNPEGFSSNVYYNNMGKTWHYNYARNPACFLHALNEGYVHNFSYIGLNDKYSTPWSPGTKGLGVQLRLGNYFILSLMSTIKGGESVVLHIGDTKFTLKRKGNGLETTLKDSSLSYVNTSDGTSIKYIGAIGGIIDGTSYYYSEQSSTVETNLQSNLKFEILGNDRYNTGGRALDVNSCNITNIEYEEDYNRYKISWEYLLDNMNSNKYISGKLITSLTSQEYSSLSKIHTLSLKNWIPSLASKYSTVSGLDYPVGSSSKVPYGEVIYFKVTFNDYASYSEKFIQVRDSLSGGSLDDDNLSYSWGDVLMWYHSGAHGDFANVNTSTIKFNGSDIFADSNLIRIPATDKSNIAHIESIKVYNLTIDTEPSWAKIGNEVSFNRTKYVYNSSTGKYIESEETCYYYNLALSENTSTTSRKFRLVVTFSNGLVFTKTCTLDALDYVTVHIHSDSIFSVESSDELVTLYDGVNDAYIVVYNNTEYKPYEMAYLDKAGVGNKYYGIHLRPSVTSTTSAQEFTITCIPVKDTLVDLNFKYCNIENTECSEADEESSGNCKTTKFKARHLGGLQGLFAGSVLLRLNGYNKYFKFMNIG